jgi:hypothetical protein
MHERPGDLLRKPDALSRSHRNDGAYAERTSARREVCIRFCIHHYCRRLPYLPYRMAYNPLIKNDNSEFLGSSLENYHGLENRISRP